MKTLIVGDIHGKVEVVQEVLQQEHPVIFVGDILDSYEYSVKDSIQCLDLIFEAIDSGKAQCLYGNHELSYMYLSMRCSGYKPATQIHMDGGYRKEMEKRFKHFLYYPGEKPVLITHAGLTNQLWDDYFLNFNTLEERLTEWCTYTHSPAYAIGHVRGGHDPVGGIFWCDWNSEFVPVPGLTQIVGHTRGKGLRKIENSFCIDFLDFPYKEHFYWDL